MSELYHYGIPGQKWGVQNGPPYPLSAQAKTVAERAAYFNDKEQRTRRLRNIGISATVAGVGAGVAYTAIGLMKAGLLKSDLGATVGILSTLLGAGTMGAGTMATAVNTLKEEVSELKLANSARWIRRNIPEWKDISMKEIMNASREGKMDEKLIPMIKDGDIRSAKANMQALLEDSQKIRQRSRNYNINNYIGDPEKREKRRGPNFSILI